MNAHDLLNSLESLEAKATKTAKNHGQWEPNVPETFFECTHGVFPAPGGSRSLCYTTSEQRAEWIADQMKLASFVPKLIAALRHEMETSEQLSRDDCGWIIKHDNDRDEYLKARRAELNAILSDVGLNEGGRV